MSDVCFVWTRVNKNQRVHTTQGNKSIKKGARETNRTGIIPFLERESATALRVADSDPKSGVAGPTRMSKRMSIPIAARNATGIMPLRRSQPILVHDANAIAIAIASANAIANAVHDANECECERECECECEC